MTNSSGSKDKDPDRTGIDKRPVGADIEDAEKETGDENEACGVILTSRQKGTLAASLYLGLCGVMLVYTVPLAIQALSDTLSHQIVMDAAVTVPFSGEAIFKDLYGSSFSVRILQIQPIDFEARFWVSGDKTIVAFSLDDVARVDHFYLSDEGWSVPLTLRNQSALQVRELADEIGAISENGEERDRHPLGIFINGIHVYNASFTKHLAAAMREGPVASFLIPTGGPGENEGAETRAEQLWLNLCPQGRYQDRCIAVRCLRGPGAGGYLFAGESLDVESDGYQIQFTWRDSVEDGAILGVVVHRIYEPQEE